MPPCNCGGGKSGVKVQYVATYPDGSSKTFNTEVEAKVSTARKGGTYTARTVR